MTIKSRVFLLLWTALAFAAVAPSPLGAQTATQSQQDLKKSCNAEAKTQKLKGDARKSFLNDCLNGAAAGGTQSPSQNTAQAPAKSPSQAPSSGTSQSAKPSGQQTAAAPSAAGQFTSEGDANRRCPSDRVVWANTASHIYHYGGTKDYGNTKQGAYMCQQDADRAGFRAAKNETAPAK